MSLPDPLPDPGAADPAQVRRDLDLVRRVLAREEGALDALIERMGCVPRMLSAIDRRRGGRLSREDREDLAQDVLARIWQKLGTFPGHTTLEPWAYRFCFLQYMNRVRRLGRRSRMHAVGELEDIEGPLPAPAGEDLDLDAEALENALERLDPKFEVVVRLKALEREDFASIASRMGIAEATAKSRYYRGLLALRRVLRPDQPGVGEEER